MRPRHGRTGGARALHLVLAFVIASIALAAFGAGVARAWHAEGVTVAASCDSHSGTFIVTAEIQQSQDWPGAFVKSITPSSFPGNTFGSRTVVVVIGWDQTTDTQSFTTTVSLPAHCVAQHTGTLVVIKHVVNDDGGEAVAGDWTMNVSGPSALSFAGAESPGTSSSVTAGDYTVSESGGPSGYTLSYSGDCDSGGHVTVPAFHTKTCVLTNDDVTHEAPKGTLVVIKHVVNDDGGEAVAGDWTMNVSGPSALSFAGAESPGTSSSVTAGDYTVSESGGPSGYTLSYSGDCDSGGHVTVPAFHTKTCVLTNDDVTHEAPKGTLVVIKHVVNDDGGDAVAGDWTMNVSGPASFSFAGAESPGTSSSVTAGDYTVSESGGPSGYTLSYSGDCDSSGHVTVSLIHPATCVLTNDDVKRHHAGQGSISVSKSADPTSLKEPGGPVTFSVRITNTSANVNVVITNVVDDKFGDLDDDGGSGCFDVPINLAPGGSASCQFSEQITGPGGTTHVDTVTASGHDENGNPVSGSASATVVITAKLIDLVITKQATSPTKLNGTVHYTMTVTNKGPDTATNVQLADPAPAGITYLTASTSQGSCTVTPALITCNLGTIAPGQTVTITATGKSTTVGSHTNTATVTGSGGRETNPADNVASAVTVTPAPITPPTKPKPHPHPQPCLALTVTPKMIKADGKLDSVVVKVTAGHKSVAGAKVVLQGAGIQESGRTNSKGIVILHVNPTKAGLMTISTPETRHSCGSRRIGVAGVFLPPVTG